MFVRIAIIAVSALFIAGCGTGKSNAEKKVDKGQAKIEQLQANVDELSIGGIKLISTRSTITYQSTYTCTVPSDLTAEDRAEAIEILEENVRLADQILNIADDDDIIVTGEQNIERIREASRNCISKLSI